jgi:alpha-1,3-glucosyltransferase
MFNVLQTNGAVLCTSNVSRVGKQCHCSQSTQVFSQIRLSPRQVLLVRRCRRVGGFETYQRPDIANSTCRRLNLFVNIGFFSTVTLLLCFAPFFTSITQVQHVLARIFPFGRGLFEDKVANVWCSLNVVIKLRQLFSSSTLARLAAVATLAATMPLVAGFVWTNIQLQPTVSGITGETARKPLSTRRPAPTAKLLPHTLFASAMAFFLFSFQVHEKSVLLPLMPLTLLLVGKQPGLPGQDFEWAMLLNNVGTFR